MIVEISDMNSFQLERLTFIEFRLRFIGELSRRDLMKRFSIQVAAATRDIALYKRGAPQNIKYDARRKVYMRGEEFQATIDLPVDRVLFWLSKGFGENHLPRFKRSILGESLPPLAKLNLEIISVLTTAIFKKGIVKISHLSLKHGLNVREIVPFAIVDNGNRWHVRAYDRESQGFRDFSIARMIAADAVAGDVEEHELPDRDIQWNRIVEMELVPHPVNVQHFEAIETEYGMSGGILKIGIRAALAGYMLWRWNVDCSEDHGIKGAAYHLWLRNNQALYGVANLELAPGYYADRKKPVKRTKVNLA